jgi:multiple sugar transport system ATP-binding protein
VLGIRPETFADAALAPRDRPRIEVEVAVVEELGSDGHVFFPVTAPRITAEVLEAGEEATLLAAEGSLFNARVDARTQARVGGRLALALDPSRFHFFDPVTGETLLRAGASAARAEPELAGAAVRAEP